MSVDASIRERALIPDRSFIVQAPAGSGKTSLLVQRYLKLLAIVDAPEEILAITFTRKAAGEMKGRILDWLAAAKEHPEPEQDYLKQSWHLAREALERDASQGWNLNANPSRLRVMTVDAFNGLLAAQMPIMSRSGAQVPVVDDAESLYREAARKLPQSLGTDHLGAVQLEVLLRHLDNNVGRLEQLIITMLACRDHWLGIVHGDVEVSRPFLESALAHLLAKELSALTEAAPHGLLQEMLELARFSFSQLGRDFDYSDDALDQRLIAWRQLADLFLTKAGTPRKAFNKNHGFVIGSDEQKRHAKAVGEKLGVETEFCRRLSAVWSLPNATYDDKQWDVLDALMGLLPVAAAQLELVFREHRQMDFIGISNAALYALGDEDNPTDLALALDYRISHILVDEFQDTSFTQHTLLLRLTAGWVPGDGRTFFCVGDPMQSIYRFRQAEVGLFLRAAQEGLPQLPLEALRLSSNFRSDAGIVHWVNRSFKKIFPGFDDLETSAVAYAPSDPERPGEEANAVTIHPFFEEDRHGEARRILEIIRTFRHLQPGGSLAILVSSRAHLAEIIPALNHGRIRFQAVEIDALTSRAGIQDLLSLTLAILSHSHRTAWLSVLRAPWCGLTLKDLVSLVVDQKTPIWELLSDNASLSTDGRERLQRFISVMGPALARRGQVELHNLVEQTWIALGGPACLETADDLVDVRVFFELLRSRGIAGDLPDSDQLEHYLSRLFAASDPQASEAVQIMTIHRAKGLEFDSVILPGLGRATSGDEAKLLRWLEVPRSHNRRDLVLATVAQSGESPDPIYKYLQQVELQRDRNERARLLYVATTRAKKQLHLLGDVGVDEKRNVMRGPKKHSLLSHLWSVASERFERAYGQRSPQLKQQSDLKLGGVRLRRLSRDWRRPNIDEFELSNAAHGEPDLPDDISFHWVGNTSRHVGTVVHLLLQQIATRGALPSESGFRGAIESWLQRLGVAQNQMPEAANQVQAAVEQTLKDPRGRWVLSDRHTDAKSEFPLTGLVDGKFRSVVLDRTFVDQDDIRWVVDFKTSRHEGTDIDAFLDNEQIRYAEQMHQYGELISRMDSRTVKLALYFPLLSGWREWPYKALGHE